MMNNYVLSEENSQHSEENEMESENDDPFDINKKQTQDEKTYEKRTKEK